MTRFLARSCWPQLLVGAPGGHGREGARVPEHPAPGPAPGDAVAFVGKLVSSSNRAGATYWRFDVDQRVKGPIGKEVDIRAPQLTDAKGRPLDSANEVGVLATLDGATIVTDSCLLTDPAALLAVSDKDRGAPIKVAARDPHARDRARRLLVPDAPRQQAELPGLPNDPGARAREARGR